jgi:hypothetical protein
VRLVRDVLAAVAVGVGARLEATGEGNGLALDQVLGGRLGLPLPEDQVHVQRAGLTVAPVAGDRHGRDVLARAGRAELDAAREMAVAGEGEHQRGLLGVVGEVLTQPSPAGRSASGRQRTRQLPGPAGPAPQARAAGAADGAPRPRPLGKLRRRQATSPDGRQWRRMGALLR